VGEKIKWVEWAECMTEYAIDKQQKARENGRWGGLIMDEGSADG